ncbi:MAG: ATP synthase F1 subunit delta [Oscillospiraceae bacterium]
MAGVEKVYATSLMDVAVEKNIENELLQQLTDISDIFKQNNEIYKLIGTPILSKDQKKDTLKNIFKGRINDYLLNFLMVLSDNNRVDNISSISSEFKNIYNQKNNICEVVVTSVKELTLQQKEKLTKKLELEMSNTIKITNEIDPTIIGGLILKIKNKQIDSSVKTRLSSIQDAIDSNLV